MAMCRLICVIQHMAEPQCEEPNLEAGLCHMLSLFLFLERALQHAHSETNAPVCIMVRWVSALHVSYNEAVQIQGDKGRLA